MRQMLVHFEGEGSGSAEMSWGQLELWGAMQRHRSRMPLPDIQRLPPGTTVDDLADWLRYVMSRHQAMRTRIQTRPDGPPRQVLYDSGEIAIDIVEAGDADPAVVARQLLEWRDHYVETEFDFAAEWPVFLAVIQKEGVPTHRLLTVVHIVTDAFGALALLADLADRDAGRPARPITAMQPLAQARWQHSPDAERHRRTVLRYWEDVLRQMPARQFPPPVDRGEPRHWALDVVSPATRKAVDLVRSRASVPGAQVILAIFLIALARVTGVNPPAARVAVNNRFRRELADSVSVITQYGLCVLDVGGIGFDEVLSRLGRRMLATLKNGYFDPLQVNDLVERVSRERGEEVDIHCYYNDRRLSPDTDLTPDTVPTAADVLAARALTSVTDEPLPRGSERLFVAVEEAPDTFRLMMQADTWHVSRAAMLACARAVEQVAVQAALDATAPTEVPA